jgi:hypothetical protein
MKMKLTQSLYIPSLEIGVSVDTIMETFYINNIATISRITLLPFIKKSGKFNRAYIDIAYWHDSESSYNFVQSLYDKSRETRIVYNNDDQWWAVRINKRIDITYDAKFISYTTINYLIEELMDYEHEQLNNPKKYANPAGAKLLEYIREDPLWRDIEKELSDVLMYQNLEYQLYL